MGSNVKGGNEDRPGSLQQCRSARGPTFSGQYCKVSLEQGSVEYFEGICIPDSCSEEEVQTLVLQGQWQQDLRGTALLPHSPRATFLLAKLQIGPTSLIPPLPLILVNESTQELVSIRCLSNILVPDTFVCCVMVAIPLAATLLTAMIRWQRDKEVMPSAESSRLGSDLNLYGTMRTTGSSRSEPAPFTMEENSSTCHGSAPPSCVRRWLQAFSLQTTSQGVFSTSTSIQGGSYSSLNGIRVLSLLWIMSGHSTELILAGLASLPSEGDPAVPIRATSALSGAPQMSLGSRRDLDHPGLRGWLWRINPDPDVSGYLGSSVQHDFACYLIHPLFILTYLGWQETPIHYTDLNFMYLFFGHLVLSLGASFALHVLIERPFLLLKLSST
ncbi:unnamed protein product [Tetraodon nigroviridis]|uniref:(spotted green pufferfish) hypothetical protein n=1 Tax=Tetraodon nigroviridis TaxID=99883 RepID=Q4SQD2_TETNG|nr:unnamed protein product [Tetraodon nigroviridis]